MEMQIPESHEVFMQWDWAKFEPYFASLEAQELTENNVDAWLFSWSRLNETLSDYATRLQIAMTQNTADQQARDRYELYMDTIFPNAMAREQALKAKLLESKLVPPGMQIPVRNFAAEADLFHEENLALLAQEQKLARRYDQIVGAETVEWDGEEMTVTQLRPILQSDDRALRERAWRAAAERQLEDRPQIDQLWTGLLALRLQIARNAGKPDYRAYRWQQHLRFAYSPEDALRFDRAIEKTVVPAAERIYEHRRERLGLDRLRPWDLNVDPLGRAPLRPYKDIDALKAGVSNIFHRVHPQLGAYFDTMVAENSLDLENRKNKAPGAYCETLEVIRRPFIFANSVGIHDSVQTVLHESGHAFHVFESAPLAYSFQLHVPTEFAEVASMGMELLASPYLTQSTGGFYSPQEAARALIENLEDNILFWPYMAVVDSFQHWAYENSSLAEDPRNCDMAWAELWQRFMPGVDWTGLDAEMETGWQRKLHIFQIPFYYIEYGLAQLGAVQVWANSLKNPIGAVENYRKALALGGTVTLPELFEAAGARLAFDANTLGRAVNLMETTIQQLEEKYQEE